MVIGTSPSSDMFTISHEKEQELPETMRHQERKGKVKKESGTQIKSNLIWYKIYIAVDVSCEYLEHFQTFKPKELAWDRSIPQHVVLIILTMYGNPVLLS